MQNKRRLSKGNPQNPSGLAGYDSWIRSDDEITELLEQYNNEILVVSVGSVLTRLHGMVYMPKIYVARPRKDHVLTFRYVTVVSFMHAPSREAGEKNAQEVAELYNLPFRPKVRNGSMLSSVIGLGGG